MEIKVERCHSNAKLPFKSHSSDLGIDFCIVEDDDFSYTKDGDRVFYLNPLDKHLFCTGIRLLLPLHYGLLLKDRSGYASKFGLHVLAGVIDQGYTGEIKICIVNLGKMPICFYSGDKVAQGILIKNNYFDIVEEKIEVNTERGDKGFGSTG